jgi:hypothetical protein
MTYHYHHGENLEALLEQIDDAHERALVIDQAYELLGSLALDSVEVVEHIEFRYN